MGVRCCCVTVNQKQGPKRNSTIERNPAQPHSKSKGAHDSRQSSSERQSKHISEQDLLSRAQLGDILLFKTSGSSAKLTRTITRSQYDHIGVIVHMPLQPNELHFIESVSGQGVRLQTFRNVAAEVGPQKFYQKVVYRPVSFNRSETTFQLMDQFMDEAIGHSYDISGLKLLKRSTNADESVECLGQSMMEANMKHDLNQLDQEQDEGRLDKGDHLRVPLDENEAQVERSLERKMHKMIHGSQSMVQSVRHVGDSMITENRTFFCSELVAKAFKIIGVIEDNSTSCTRFYPKHFSQEADNFLQLRPGVTLGQEMTVEIRAGAGDKKFINQRHHPSEVSHQSHFSTNYKSNFRSPRSSHVSHYKSERKSSSTHDQHMFDDSILKSSNGDLGQ